MPLQSTSGAASYDAFGGGAAAEPVYIEDAFSCFLYSGTSSTQTITNGIDLAGDGGLVWTKMRNTGAFGNSDHWLFDTARGVEKKLSTNTTDAQGATSGALQQFNANGYQLGYTGGGYYELNYTGNTYVSWTLKKQPKFFDVVTYTGDGTSSRAIAHSLTSTPGCIIVKRTDSTGVWYVYHRGVDPTLAYAYFMVLNTTAARAGAPAVWDVAPTSTNFTVQPDTTNISGATYVAYLFAHNAGGFGLTGTDNVISCGSYTGNGSSSGPVVTLGYEPQWVMIKNASDVSNWSMIDNMRGWNVIDGAANVALLSANLSSAEVQSQKAKPLSTGFQINDDGSVVNTSGATYIYIAIRRGPMKVPTSGTSVFSPNLETVADGTGTKLTTNFPVDLQIMNYTPGTSSNSGFLDRLRGIATTTTESGQRLISSATSAEASASVTRYWDNTGFQVSSAFNNSRTIYWNFQRAPSFFDEVCYTGTGSATTFTHNLGVAPELMIVKRRSTAGNNWCVYSSFLTATNRVFLNTTAATAAQTSIWNDTEPTSTVFTVGTNDTTNASGSTYVAYLFATCAGVSKVTSFTGNGSSQTINCGFTGGARLVLIKRTDSTGDWYIWDSARGIVSGNDPHLSLNSTTAEVTTDDTIDTDSTGFIVNQVSATNCNVNGANYIVLAVA